MLFQLLENAVAYTDADVPKVTVSVETLADGVRVRVIDNGPGLPSQQRRVLETGEIAEYDDPDAGFGLNVVRLLVESFGGTIETEVVDGGTTIVLTLVRADAAAPSRPDVADIQSYGVAPYQLLSAVGAALLAGAAMGAVLHAVAGVVPVIGALYGVTDPVVGLVTHQFHSVVFGLVYAAIIAAAPAKYTARFSCHLLIALMWAGFLWLVLAGVVMPAWLRLVGIDAALSNVTPVVLLGHAVWGSTLATVYYVATAVTPGDATRTVRSSLWHS